VKNAAARRVLATLAYVLPGLGAFVLGVLGLLHGHVAVPDLALATEAFWYWGAETFWFCVGGVLVFGASVQVRELFRSRRRTKARTAAAAAASQPQAPKPPPSPDAVKSTSPGGRYVVRVYPWEARMSLWIESPELYDTAAGQALFVPKDSHWSLDSAVWKSESVVAMQLRKYPGDHLPCQFEVTFDCVSLHASLGGVAVGNVAKLEQALEQAYETGQKAFAASRKN